MSVFIPPSSSVTPRSFDQLADYLDSVSSGLPPSTSELRIKAIQELVSVCSQWSLRKRSPAVLNAVLQQAATLRWLATEGGSRSHSEPLLTGGGASDEGLAVDTRSALLEAQQEVFTSLDGLWLGWYTQKLDDVASWGETLATLRNTLDTLCHCVTLVNRIRQKTLKELDDQITRLDMAVPDQKASALRLSKGWCQVVVSGAATFLVTSELYREKREKVRALGLLSESRWQSGMYSIAYESNGQGQLLRKASSEPFKERHDLLNALGADETWLSSEDVEEAATLLAHGVVSVVGRIIQQDFERITTRAQELLSSRLRRTRKKKEKARKRRAGGSESNLEVTGPTDEQHDSDRCEDVQAPSIQSETEVGTTRRSAVDTLKTESSEPTIPEETCEPTAPDTANMELSEYVGDTNNEGLMQAADLSVRGTDFELAIDMSKSPKLRKEASEPSLKMSFLTEAPEPAGSQTLPSHPVSLVLGDSNQITDALEPNEIDVNFFVDESVEPEALLDPEPGASRVQHAPEGAEPILSHMPSMDLTQDATTYNTHLPEEADTQDAMSLEVETRTSSHIARHDTPSWAPSLSEDGDWLHADLCQTTLPSLEGWGLPPPSDEEWWVTYKIATGAE